MASKFEQLVADAVAHHKAGRLDQAEAAYRDALGISPGHAAITHNLGVIAAAQGRHRDALGYFDAAIAAEPQYASAHYNRASALQALGQSREAIAELRAGLRDRARPLRRPSRARLPLARRRRPRPRARSFRAHLRAQARRRPIRHRGQVLT